MKFILYVFVLFACGVISCSSGDKSTTAQSASEAGKPKTYKPSIQSSIKIILPDTAAAKGTTVCLPVRTAAFNHIVSMQYSINWDPSVLSFQKVQNFQLKALSQSSFGLTQTERGKMGTSWYDPAVEGMTIPDGSTLYEICFEVIGAPGQESILRVSSDPVVVEVSNAQEQLLGIPTGGGKFRVE